MFLIVVNLIIIDGFNNFIVESLHIYLFIMVRHHFYFLNSLKTIKIIINPLL